MKHFVATVSLILVVSQSVIAGGNADGLLSIYAPVPVASGVPLAECLGYVELKVVLSPRGSVARSQVLESFPQGKFEEVVLASIANWYFKNFDVHKEEPRNSVKLRVAFGPRRGVCEGSSISSTEPIEVLEPSPSCLGVVVQELTPELLARLGLDPRRGGVIVSRASPGSPAAEGGLRSMDVIDRFNSRPVDRQVDFIFAVARPRPGEGFEIVALRSGKYITIAGSMGRRAPDGYCEPVSDGHSSP